VLGVGRLGGRVVACKSSSNLKEGGGPGLICWCQQVSAMIMH